MTISYIWIQGKNTTRYARDLCELGNKEQALRFLR